MIKKTTSTTTSFTTSLSPAITNLPNQLTKRKFATAKPSYYGDDELELPPIPNYTAPPPIPHAQGSYDYHKAEAKRDNYPVDGMPKLTNVIRGSWTQRPVLNYNIVEHLGREPANVDTLPDGSRILVEPSQFTPLDVSHVPTIDSMTPYRSGTEVYQHHNELLRIKGAMAAAPNPEAASKEAIDRWMTEFRSHIWQPSVQDYQTQPSRARMRLIDHFGLSYGKGGRKSSKAFATLKPGSGHIFINSRPYTEYFPGTEQRSQVGMAFYTTGTVGQFDAFIKVHGGGMTGQCEAIKLAVSNALQNFDPRFRPTLKVNGLLKRDGRSVERKHAGRKKARKSFAWVKR
jgi:small subunit ribosomal protein S9